jgi:hypothetical protein
MALDRIAGIIRFAALVELGVGILLLIDPARVVALLLGTPNDATAQAVGRWCGIALLAIAAAWWPVRGAAAVQMRVFYSALIYNSLMGLFLPAFSMVRHMGGLLLWPAAALHALIALLLVITWQVQYRTKATGVGT